MLEKAEGEALQVGEKIEADRFKDTLTAVGHEVTVDESRCSPDNEGEGKDGGEENQFHQAGPFLMCIAGQGGAGHLHRPGDRLWKSLAPVPVAAERRVKGVGPRTERGPGRRFRAAGLPG